MKNELAVIVKESGLDKTKSQIILDNFQNYFKIASEWEERAKAIVVKSEDQVAEMNMARTGRLFLREKRIHIENKRKELKELSLREGKAIDAIATVLKSLIVPIEEYLDKQEHFVEYREKEKQEKLRIEMEKKIEEERIAKEKADAEERERQRIENEKLKAEAVKKQAELDRAKRKLEAEKEKAESEREAAELKAKKEKEAVQAKAAAEMKAIQEKARNEREEAARKEAEAQAEKARLEKLLENQITCPFCNKKFQLKKEKK